MSVQYKVQFKELCALTHASHQAFGVRGPAERVTCGTESISESHRAGHPILTCRGWGEKQGGGSEGIQQYSEYSAAA